MPVTGGKGTQRNSRDFKLRNNRCKESSPVQLMHALHVIYRNANSTLLNKLTK